MSRTLRFPNLRATPQGATPELDQVITILPTTNTLLVGGEATYANIATWKQAGNRNEAIYTCIVLEFTATQAGIIGDGSIPIGLFGQVNLNATGAPTNQRRRALLGILGVNLGGAYPQIPIIAQASGELVGYSQLTADIAPYDALSIGAVTSNISTGDSLVTVTARPIRARDYAG